MVGSFSVFFGYSEHTKAYRLKKLKVSVCLSAATQSLWKIRSTVRDAIVAIMRVLFKMMIKQLIRTVHSTIKRISKMKNLRRKKKSSLAESVTKRLNRSIKRLKCQGLNVKVISITRRNVSSRLKLRGHIRCGFTERNADHF